MNNETSYYIKGSSTKAFNKNQAISKVQIKYNHPDKSSVTSNKVLHTHDQNEKNTSVDLSYKLDVKEKKPQQYESKLAFDSSSKILESLNSGMITSF